MPWSNAVTMIGAGQDEQEFYDALVEELGPFDSPLLRLEAERVAEAWVERRAATMTLNAARWKRAHAKGRRPSAMDVERLARRQGLADLTYSRARTELCGLVKELKRNGRTPPGPDELLAGLQGTTDGD